MNDGIMEKLIDDLSEIKMKFGSEVIEILAAKLILEHELPQWRELKKEIMNIKRIKK